MPSVTRRHGWVAAGQLQLHRRLRCVAWMLPLPLLLLLPKQLVVVVVVPGVGVLLLLVPLLRCGAGCRVAGVRPHRRSCGCTSLPRRLDLVAVVLLLLLLLLLQRPDLQPVT